MRFDLAGLFWDETPVKKESKAKKKLKRNPPEPAWEDDDYLPYLEDALAFRVSLFDEVGLVAASQRKETLIFDIEAYKNYWCICFKSVQSGLVAYEEFEHKSDWNRGKIKWIMENFETVGFNSNHYDVPILCLALYKDVSTKDIKMASDAIIQEGLTSWRFFKKFKIEKPTWNHIDIKEVAPLDGSLKIYGGRLHTKKMQDLPYPESAFLSPNQIAVTRLYCINDLDVTLELFNALNAPIALRVSLSDQYNVDLRSKSDAQIAEAVISSEIQAKTGGKRIFRPSISAGTVYRYRVPKYMRYESPLMQWVIDKVANTKFVVSEKGNVTMPKELADLKIQINQTTYTMGIGGLHSCEKSISHYSDDFAQLSDHDVESYYPRIILNQKLFPQHLGRMFLVIYNSIVERRLKAKHSGDKNTSNSLKIVINGSFGKLGSQYSNLYAPDLLVQVTLTGQLSLLLLIERMEMAGIPVVSANTDGIVVKCPTEKQALKYEIIEQWEKDTDFITEENKYLSLHSRDINNYVAVKPDRSAKTKGAYSRPGLSKNPQNEVCIDALDAYLTKGIAVEQTINDCKDFTKFLSVRRVKGGAVECLDYSDLSDVKYGDYLGKVVRFYYANDRENADIVYAKSGNRVPKSEGAKPMMQTPNEFPSDVNHNWYIEETQKMLELLGIDAFS